MKKMYAIYDWAGNLIQEGFEDFEDAWGHIMEKFPNEEDHQEFFVEEYEYGG